MVLLLFLATVIAVSPAAARDLGYADETGTLVVRMGEMQFRVGNVALSECSHGAVLDAVALFCATDRRGSKVVLKGRWHLDGGAAMLRKRMAAAVRYLTESRGLDPDRITVESDVEHTTTPDPELRVSIEAYVVLTGLEPQSLVTIEDGCA